MDKLINAGISDELFEYIAKTIENTPFYQLLGMRLKILGKGTAELSCIAEKTHTNALGVIHGGLYIALADASMGQAVRTLGVRGVTAEISSHLMASLPLGSELTARGQVIKAGRSLVFASSEVNCGDKILCRCTGTFFRTGDIKLEK